MMASTDRASQWQGIALVAVGAFFFSTAIIFTRWTDGLSSLTIAFFRALTAFLFLCLLLPRFPEPARVRTYRASIPRLVALGAIVSVTVSLYTYSIQHTTAANAALLVNSSPIYVALLAPVLLKEASSRHTLLSVILAIIGIVLVSEPGKLDFGSDSFAGIAAGALSGFTYSFTMIFGRGLRGKVTGLTQTMWSTGMTALVLSPWALQASSDVIIDNLPVLIPLGIFSLGLSYLFFFLGLQRVPAQVASVVALFEPVCGALIGLFLFAEVPTILSGIGGLLILLSIFLITRE